MRKVQEIQLALKKLPAEEQWEVAYWLLNEIEGGMVGKGSAQKSSSLPGLPDYAARRRRIFGEKVLPNMVLLARSEERW